MPPRPDAALRARAAAAHMVLKETPGVDRIDLLAAVVWPMRPELKAVEQRLKPSAERSRATPHVFPRPRRARR
jgi:hypothetical protein